MTSSTDMLAGVVEEVQQTMRLLEQHFHKLQLHETTDQHQEAASSAIYTYSLISRGM